MDEWIKKNVVFIHIYAYNTKVYSAIRRMRIFPFVATQIKLESIKLSELSPKKQILYNLTPKWN